MKTVLVALNAKFAHSSLALRYLRAYQEKQEILVREFSINDSLEHMYAALLFENASVYAFSCYIWNMELTLRLAEMLKTALPEAQILFGGPEAGHRADRVLFQYPFVDMVIVGEGEETLKDVLESLEKKNPLSGIRGLARRGEPLIPRPLLDLTKMPQPYTQEDITENKDKILYFETSRGCPFHCSYCLSSAEDKVRPFPMGYVKEGLSRFFAQNVPLVKLIDRTFNYDSKRAIEILTFILKHSKNTCVHMELEPRILTPELLEVLKSAPKGKFQVEMGVQSTNPQTLKAVGRAFDWERMKENILTLRSFGNMHIHLDLIAGLPYEDYEGFGKSFDDVYDLKPHMLQLGFLKVLPGTVLERESRIRAVSFPPYEVVATDWISAQELCYLKEVEEAVELFYNSGAFAKTIEKLTKTHPFAVFESLGRLLKQEQQNGKKPRKAWYEILYDTYGESVRAELSEDFIRNNKSIPLPEFVRPKRERGFKDKAYRLMKDADFCKKYAITPDLTRLRFERMNGRAFMMDYQTNRLFDITEEIKEDL
ncbi:MAG: DUF4080 domain-containing protein [Clostridia bacterium]|nr:DUF4080 domain-containing protein [Clostridia bacterium]